MPAPQDPWSAGIMAAGSVATSALNDKTNMTNGVNYSSVWDSSGWTVNTGRGATQSTQTDRTTATSAPAALLSNPMGLIAIALVLYAVMQK